MSDKLNIKTKDKRATEMSFNSQKRFSKSALCTANYGKEKSYKHYNINQKDEGT